MRDMNTKNEGYTNRNGTWVRLLITGIILAFIPLPMSVFDSPIPPALPWSFSAIAFLLAGIFVKTTDSLSALIACWAIELIAVLMAALAIYEMFFT